MEEITTLRLLIRPYNMNDLSDVHEYSSDPDVCKYMIWGPNTLEETKVFIEKTIENIRNKPIQNYELAIIKKEIQKTIGGCGLINISYEHKEAEIGYCLNRKYWGKGYGTEATNAMLQYGFKNLNLHRIYATCDINNKLSERIFIKLRMEKEGVLREHKYINNRWKSSLLYSILETEYYS